MIASPGGGEDYGPIYLSVKDIARALRIPFYYLLYSYVNKSENIREF